MIQFGTSKDIEKQDKKSLEDSKKRVNSIINSLQSGNKIQLKFVVRINSNHSWISTTEGTYIATNHLRTGLSTDRVVMDDIVVTTVHLVKTNGERTSIILDNIVEILCIPK